MMPSVTPAESIVPSTSVRVTCTQDLCLRRMAAASRQACLGRRSIVAVGGFHHMLTAKCSLSYHHHILTVSCSSPWGLLITMRVAHHHEDARYSIVSRHGMVRCLRGHTLHGMVRCLRGHTLHQLDKLVQGHGAGAATGDRGHGGRDRGDSSGP